jgi:hypothetical protein
LSDHQRSLLLFGEDPFEPELMLNVGRLSDLELKNILAEREARDFPEGARQTWTKYRTELMTDSSLSPGRRPSAFWRFDVGVVPPAHWWQELAMLLERDLLAREDAFAIERCYVALTESPAAYASFDTPAGVRTLALSASVVAHCQQQFELAAKWHEWRSRPELAKSYARRAAACKHVLQNADECGIKAH